jgi:(p)ppGpp synthase/HD superfamily hydrolase
LAELADAVAAAVAWHGSQRRKDGAPYVSHLLQVCGLVLEHGGSHEAAVAALLHDVVEDTDATFDDVAARFGAAVASIVRECTDSIEGEGRGHDTWERRKALYLSHLVSASADAALVSACDKLHNLRSMVRGDVSATSFHAPADRQEWFYSSLISVLSDRGDVSAAILDELRSLTALAWR